MKGHSSPSLKGRQPRWSLLRVTPPQSHQRSLWAVIEGCWMLASSLQATRMQPLRQKPTLSLTRPPGPSEEERKGKSPGVQVTGTSS